MNIAYGTRSEFRTSCIDAITNQQEELNAGRRIDIALKQGGYSGGVTVIIDSANPEGFGTDWTAKDTTRFPSRIKAAATALRDCNSVGEFAISYAGGTLSITMAQPAGLSAPRHGEAAGA